MGEVEIILFMGPTPRLWVLCHSFCQSLCSFGLILNPKWYKIFIQQKTKIEIYKIYTVLPIFCAKKIWRRHFQVSQIHFNTTCSSSLWHVNHRENVKTQNINNIFQYFLVYKCLFNKVNAGQLLLIQYSRLMKLVPFRVQKDINMIISAAKWMKKMLK